MSDSKAQIGAPGTTSTSDPSPCPSILPLSRSSSRPSICQDDTCSQKPTPPVQSSASSAFDIEHVPVSNDPRQWSPLRKNISLVLIASGSMIAGLAANIQNPAVEEMERDLPATSSQFSLSISLFILLQGVMPMVWSCISEIKGRKKVYVSSLALFTIGTIIVAISRHIGLVIAFRCVQAIGSSAVMAIGAASLADIFDPVERGRKMGIYYIAPLLGPALGPIFGGFLTTAFGWRAIFWFLAIVSGTCTLSFLLFFHDTFRKERSLSYQNILRRRLREVTASQAQLSEKGADTKVIEATAESDVEKKGDAENGVPAADASGVRVSLTDMNPFPPMIQVLKRKNNLAILLSSGILYSYNFLVPYTSARTLSAYYGYNPLKIGLVTLSYGIGCVVGSLAGGRWSDRELVRLKEKNGGISYPEMRLRSTFLGIILLPPSVLAYGWVCQQHTHVAAICATLFLTGFSSIWIYSSSLAYTVDANNGRSGTAVAANSAFRGGMAFIATEIAVPMQDGLGDGWMYTIWSAIMLFSGFLVILVSWKGVGWREEAEERESRSTDTA